jgi:hypothetical protein
MDQPQGPVAILVGTAADHAEPLVGMPDWPRRDWSAERGISDPRGVSGGDPDSQEPQDDDGPYFLNLVVPDSSAQLGSVFIERLLQYLKTHGGLPDLPLAPLSPAFVFPCAYQNAKDTAHRSLQYGGALACVSRRALRSATDDVAGVPWSVSGPPVVGSSVVYADYYHGAGYVLRAGHAPETAVRAMLAVNKDSRETFGPYFHEFLGHEARPARMVYEGLHRPELYLVRGWVESSFRCNLHATYDCDQSTTHAEPLNTDPNTSSQEIVRRYTPMSVAPKSPPVDAVLRALKLRSCYVSLGFSRHVTSDAWILVEARCYPLTTR